MKDRLLAMVSRQCVACGCCEKACPKQAIAVDHGLRANVNGEKCIGCGLCAKACPADVISMEQRSVGV